MVILIHRIATKSSVQLSLEYCTLHVRYGMKRQGISIRIYLCFVYKKDEINIGLVLGLFLHQFLRFLNSRPGNTGKPAFRACLFIEHASC